MVYIQSVAAKQNSAKYVEPVRLVHIKKFHNIQYKLQLVK